jgi:DTW domain-containing protein YfiP
VPCGDYGKQALKLQDYHDQRKDFPAQTQVTRAFCTDCRQSAFNCYCAHVQRFDPRIEFVILIHPLEVRRRIATGRMSHLCLANSHLIEGEDFADHALVNQLIASPEHQAVMLYPGPGSIDLSALDVASRRELFRGDKKLLVFVIDGTWAKAKRMVRLNPNISVLPRVCFSRATPSTFRVRQQPAEGCFSSIEAIHQVIDLVGAFYGFPSEVRQHDNLLWVFDQMVERQLPFVPTEPRHRRGAPSAGVN